MSELSKTGTLTLADTLYRLSTLVGSNVWPGLARLVLSAYEGDAAGAGANTDTIFVGDINLSYSNYKGQVKIGQPWSDEGTTRRPVDITQIYVMSPTAGQKLCLGGR